MAPTAAERPWFEPLVRTLERPALAFAMMLTRDRSTAEEIVQEAFVRVWAAPNTPSEEAEFRRWLYRAIQNLAIDHARRQHRFTGLRLWSKAPPNPLDAVDRWMEDEELAAALRTLTPRERLAVHLRYYDDLDFTRVDAMLQGRPGTGRKLVARALAKLRDRLPADPAEDRTP
ncbi:MAG: sigma-70 family RNA polymerase sigma factor [Candidatus Dormibacteraeota bacterium]|nr:sigma-70 family RNA polymerase sigma factor [Candidatus Dormibacteraeota bacterium]